MCCLCLAACNTSKSKKEVASDTTTVQVSTSVYQTKQQSKDFSKVWGSKSKIGGYDAYVVNCIAKNGKYLVIWIFKSDDGKFRYVSLEGTPEVLKDMLPLIEQSWTTKKN